MTFDDIRKDKEELEKEIALLVEKFSDKYHIAVKGTIGFNVDGTYQGWVTPYHYCTLELRL